MRPITLLMLIPGLFLFSTLSAQDKAEPKKTRKLTGEVVFKDKHEFGPETIATILLQDVSLADAPAKKIAGQTIKNLKAFPIPFAIEYDPEAINPSFTYSLSVRITTKDKLDFINDTSIRVLTREAPDKNIQAPVVKVGK